MNKEIEQRLKLLHTECNPKAREEDINYTINYITNLQQENGELTEEIKCLKRLFKEQEEREYHSKFLKDFQEKNGKNCFPDHDEIYKRYDDYKSRCEKAIPMLKELNQCIKDILDIGIDIKNISDIEDLLRNGSDSQ